MKRLKRRICKYLPIIKIVFLLFAAGCLLLAVSRLLLPVFLFLNNFVKASRQPSLRTSNDRVNILLLGSGGLDHAAPDLTDSIIFASIRVKDGETILLSIPRDIWVDSMRAKINTAYHYGEEKKKGGGLILAKAAVSETLGQPIHYAILLDFSGFVKAVDLVGGVEIKVERAFDDYKYPIPGMEEAEPEELRYEHLHFDNGLQHMNGERALKYIRSRYAENEEGTDFARSERQQKFLLAFKNKVLSVKTFLNPKRIKELAKILGDSIDTDIKEREYPEFLKLALKLKQSKIKTVVLNEDLLYTPLKSEYDNQWVLVPKSGDWQEVQEYVKSLMPSP